MRRIIEVEGRKTPATLSLLGCEGKFYLGIKVTVFNWNTVSESGFFMTINQKEWERSEEEKKAMRKK